MPSTLGYWNIRGLGQAVRLLLVCAGEEFEDIRYDAGDGATPHDWAKVKPTLDLPFPNLPYYIDGKLKITQHVAIMKYIAKKHGLYVEYPANELPLSDILEHIALEISENFNTIVYAPTPTDEQRQYHGDRVYARVGDVSKFLGTKKWLHGDQLTYNDVLMYEFIDQASYMFTDLLVKFPNIGAYHQRFEAMPNIKKYMNSDGYKAWPISIPTVSFGSTVEIPKRSLP